MKYQHMTRTELIRAAEDNARTDLENALLAELRDGEHEPDDPDCGCDELVDDLKREIKELKKRLGDTARAAMANPQPLIAEGYTWTLIEAGRFPVDDAPDLLKSIAQWVRQEVTPSSDSGPGAVQTKGES